MSKTRARLFSSERWACATTAGTVAPECCSSARGADPPRTFQPQFTAATNGARTARTVRVPAAIWRQPKLRPARLFFKSIFQASEQHRLTCLRQVTQLTLYAVTVSIL